MMLEHRGSYPADWHTIAKAVGACRMIHSAQDASTLRGSVVLRDAVRGAMGRVG